MNTVQANIQTSDDQELVEAVATLHQTTLADDQLSCQVCNEPINEGDEVICHLQSPAEQNCYEITQTRCADHDDLTELLTLGVDELVIDGRVGRCSDQATQQSWPVLLSPQLRLVSSASTTTGREITAQPANHDNPTEPLTVDLPESPNPSQCRGEVVADGTSETQEATLDRSEQPTIGTTEGDR
jgi:hypothetical protein